MYDYRISVYLYMISECTVYRGQGGTPGGAGGKGATGVGGGHMAQMV